MKKWWISVSFIPTLDMIRLRIWYIWTCLVLVFLGRPWLLFPCICATLLSLSIRPKYSNHLITYFFIFFITLTFLQSYLVVLDTWFFHTLTFRLPSKSMPYNIKSWYYKIIVNCYYPLLVLLLRINFFVRFTWFMCLFSSVILIIQFTGFNVRAYSPSTLPELVRQQFIQTP